MMRQFKTNNYLVVSLNNLENIYYLKIRFRKYGLYIYEMKDINKKKLLIELLKENIVLPYLDCFILILPQEYVKQTLFWKKFYKVFGASYENMIDKSVNLECIKAMILHIDKKIKINSSSIILDYGCGSGLSMLIPCKGEIVGYEPIYEMRKQAKSRGMRTISSNELKEIPEKYFDAVFFSYVFHMSVSEKNINYMMTKMKPNALWIANFYKGFNEEIINNIFRKNGFRVERVCDMQEKFGNVYEYRRNETTE